MTTELDPRALAEAVAGSYRFAANILWVMLDELVKQGADAAALARTVERIQGMNERNLDSPAIEIATSELASVISDLRARSGP